MRRSRLAIWRPGLAALFAMFAIGLGVLGPLLGSLHAASHHAIEARSSAACGCDQRETPDTSSEHDHPSDPGAPHHDCSLCLQLAGALRLATPGDLTPLCPVPALWCDLLAIGAERLARPAVDRSSRPRAPPAA